MTPATRARLIAAAKRKAVPVASCVAASVRPDHLFADVAPEDLTPLLMALIVVLAEGADPVRLREACRAGDDGLEAQGITPPAGYLAGHRNAAQLAQYATLRGNDVSIGQAAVRLGVVKRTAEKYEALLVRAGRAAWKQEPAAAGPGVLAEIRRDEARRRAETIAGKVPGVAA